MYAVEQTSDFQSGLVLLIKIPERDLDHKALYTLLSDKPDFLLPFRYRIVDAQVELSYPIGNRSKLLHLSGQRSPADYADLWSDLLQPLLDCGDWFMRPYSFLLQSDFLYCEKNKKGIHFLYVPSLKNTSNAEDLKKMVTEIAKSNPVNDIQLENKVIWAIQDFNPRSFLALFQSSAPKEVKPPKKELPTQEEGLFLPDTEFLAHFSPANRQPPKEESPHKLFERPIVAPPSPESNLSDDIAIHLPSKNKATKEKKAKSGFLSSKKNSDPTKKETAGGKASFFKKKKSLESEIIQGAAVDPLPIANHYQAPSYAQPSFQSVDEDVTQLDLPDSDGSGFRYMGSGDHPTFIPVQITTGSAFTIGRFDTSVGNKQSNFEFNRKTRAVSRRHAALERRSDGYYLIDLDSAAGTFLNGEKLPPNVPTRLQQGSRVSFGHLGADYLWEE